MNEDGWSAAHHCFDGSSYSQRLYLAANHMVDIVPLRILDSPTTGHQPEGWTCLHFASDGSDRMLRRADLVRKLLGKMANIEARTASGQTPLLLATGTGVVDVVEVLLHARADHNATTYESGMGVFQKANGHSDSMVAVLLKHGINRPSESVNAVRRRTEDSDVRQARWVTSMLKCKGKGKGSRKGGRRMH